jgi:16S rRNA A1518/A1519 N6-dimethyltransferase RsmA/KsgA/DIM1 with predicted DNA glycosylase/AP lyase activity
MDPVLRYKSGGKLLEIGPWTGIFSCNAKDAGFDVTAMDIDESCVAFLNTTLGIKALHSRSCATLITRGTKDRAVHSHSRSQYAYRVSPA